jgi:hypothetical protein
MTTPRVIEVTDERTPLAERLSRKNSRSARDADDQ